MSRLIYVKKQYKESLGLSEFPNFHASGSLIGMRRQYYGKDALLVRCGSYIYNVTKDVYDKVREITGKF